MMNTSSVQRLTFNFAATLWLGTAGLFLGTSSSVQADTNLFVAADGSAPYKSIQTAIMVVPDGCATNQVYIHIKPGTYNELIYIQREKRFFHLVGEDPGKTIITYDLHAGMTGLDGKPIGTFRTPTVTIDCEDFTAENLTFENASGPVGQALAIRIDGDRGVYKNCRFLGWQDTILANRGRQYFKDCYIAGHVDFIFGGATSYFDNCHIHCRGNGAITAASTPDTQAYGFVFNHCTITGEKEDLKVNLGRPWRIYAATAFLNTEMAGIVQPIGWNNWKKPVAEHTARYAEFDNKGPGAHPEERAKWVKRLTAQEAAALTPENVLRGSDNWKP